MHTTHAASASRQLLVAIVAILTTAQQAMAAELEEVLVTAQKREQSANDIPITISTYTGDHLDDIGITDTRDLDKLVPGFTVGESGFGTPIYTMRGVGFNERTLTAQPTVSVYTDEFNLPYGLNTKGPLLDVARIEVLKGPQGILYGRNTTGGAINYIANKPTNEFDAGTRVSYGRYETLDAEGFISGPFSDVVSGRAAVRVINSDKGDQKSNTRSGDRLGKKDMLAYRGQLQFTPSDTFLVRATVDGWEDNGEPRAPQPIAIVPQVAANLPFTLHPTYPIVGIDEDNPRVADWPGPGTGLPTDIDWENNDSQVLAGLRTEWDINDEVKLTALASYIDLEINEATPSGGLSYQHNDQEVVADMETKAFELRFSGAWGADDQIEWLLGMTYSKDTADSQRTQRLGQNTSLVDNITGTHNQFSDRNSQNDETDIEQWGVFVNTSWKFRPDFTLHLGARYTEQKQDYYTCNFEPSGTTAGSQTNGISLANLLGATKDQCFALDDNLQPGAFSDSLDEDNVSYRIALDWHATEDTLLYISYARGYKAGGFPSPAASRQLQYAPVTQEKVMALEVGAKSFLFDRQIQANIALYDYDYDDKQLFTKVLDPLFGPLGIIDNAPKSKVQGVDLEVRYAPTWLSGLVLGVNAAYVDTEVKEFFGLDNQGAPTDFSGRPFNFAPKRQYTLTLDYEHSVSSSLLGFVSADYNHSSHTNASLEGDPLYELGSYGLLGARIGVKADDGKWSGMLWGRNLTDDFKATGILSNGDVLSRWNTEGRTYGVTLEYNF
ncbi:MAG: TonB-dependent receptor [Steroidobacteraceae bacterium]